MGLQLEAMRQSKPVINTWLESGVPYVSIDGVTGLTVEPNNSEQLTDAILHLYSDKNFVSKLGKNAKIRYLELFESKKTKIKLLHVFGINNF